MSDKLPIIEELERATTFTEMAEWLCACPLAIFANHGHQIEKLVCDRGFMEAGEFVHVYVATLCKKRTDQFLPDPADAYFASKDYVQGIIKRAKKLDEFALISAQFPLTWHATRQPGEASHGG
jgi:hypothetical protein